MLDNKITHNLTMHQRLEIGLYVIFLLFSTLLIASRLFSVGPLVQRVVDVNEITAGVNLDYIVSTVFQPKPPLFGVASDSGFFPGQSTLQLYENGKQLGPAHSLHEDIRNAGGGRFSHWGNGLIFSTSDNTDPRSNARTYSVRFIAVPGLPLFGLAIAVWLLCFVRLYWISGRPAPTILRILLRLPFIALAAECAAGVALMLLFLIATFAGSAMGYSPPTTTIFRWFAWVRLIGTYDQYGAQAVLVTASLCALAAALAWLLAGTITDKLNERLVHFLSRWGFPIIAAIFIFTISGTWAGLVRVQDFNGLSIAGMIPLSDAAAYAGGAFDGLDGGSWNHVSLRRPLAAAFREFLVLAAGFSYADALLLQVTVAAFATWLAACSVARWAGAAAGFAFLSLAYVIQRSYLSTTLTEPLGLIWSLFSIPFFVLALRYGSLTGAYAALGLTTVTLLTRMSAMFLIPAVILWILIWFGKTLWQKCRILAVCLAIVAAAISLNQYLTKLYGTGANLTGSNFAYSLCGLSIGDTWASCPEKYADELKEVWPKNVKTITDFLYHRAVENIRNHPTTILRRLIDGGLQFTLEVPFSLTEGYLRPPPSTTFRPSVFAIIATCGLIIVGLFNWQWREASFWLLAIISIIVSSMFVYFDDGLRTMSASFPILALFWIRGLQQPQIKVSERPPSGRKLVITAGLIAAGITICCLGPALAIQFIQKAPLSPDYVPDSDHHYIYGGRRMSGILVVPDGDQPPKSAPSMTLSNFKALMRVAGVEHYQGLVLDGAPPPVPFAFIYAPRAEPRALRRGGEHSYIVPSEVFLDKAVPIWRLTITDWHRKPGMDNFWYLVTRADPLLNDQ